MNSLIEFPLISNEIDIIQSIFGDNCLELKNITSNYIILKYHLYNENYYIEFYLSFLYPQIDSNKVQVIFHTTNHTNHNINPLTKDQINKIQLKLNELIDIHIGNELLFILIQETKDMIHIIENETNTDNTVRTIEEDVHEIYDIKGLDAIETNEYESIYNSIEIMNNIYHSDILIERKSSFQSHFMKVKSMEEVNLFHSQIIHDKKFSKATHNIFAYRFTCPEKGIIYHDNDDDGETAAGGRLAEMLRLMNVDGVAIIVSRWFGGVLLGPDRFKYICNSARYLLEQYGYGNSNIKKR